MPTPTDQFHATETAAKPVAVSVRRAARRNAMPIIVMNDTSDDHQQTWRQSLWRWLAGPEGVSLCASIAVHVVLFLIVGFVLYLLGLTLEADEGQRGTINAFFTEEKAEDLPDLDHITDVEFDLPTNNTRSFADLLPSSSDKNDELIPEVTLADTGPQATFLPAMPESSIGPLNQANRNSRNAWKRGGFAMPANKGKIVTRGSFSVWTVPEDPQPKRSYKIVIQLNHPIEIHQFKQDITGTVKGTDGYFTGIGGSKKKNDIARQFVIPRARQIVIQIPGAGQLVKDVIRIHSKQLNESQNIEIVF